MQQNPFTPIFGRRPESLVGRETLLSHMQESLSNGPRDRSYVRLVLGQRGSGKTTVLSEMRERAGSLGMITLPIEATGTDTISAKIADSIEGTRDRYETVDVEQTASGRKLSGVQVGPVGFNWQTMPEARPKRSTRRQLERLVSWAADNQSSVLLTIDEMHGGRRDEIRQLAADLQHITNIMNMPLAFLGAGLPEMVHTLLEDKKMTFFHRCYRDHLPLVTFADAWKCLRSTIRSANGEINEDALKVLASEAQNNVAYKMQIVGYHAWDLSDAPNLPVTAADARMAIELAEQDMESQVVVSMWNDLSDVEQEFLSVLAFNNGAATPREVAEQMRSISSNELARMLRRLISAGHVERPSKNELRLVGGMSASSVRKLSEETRLFRTNKSLKADIEATEQRFIIARCNSYMPRAKAKCVLPRGHTGRCRSKT